MGLRLTSGGYTLQGAQGALTKLITEGMRTGVQPSTVAIEELRCIIAEATAHEEKEVKLAKKKKAAKRARTRKSLFSEDGTTMSDLRGTEEVLLKKKPKPPLGERIPAMVPHDTKAWDWDKKDPDLKVETKEVLKDRVKEVSDLDAITAFCAPSDDDDSEEETTERIFHVGDGGGEVIELDLDTMLPIVEGTLTYTEATGIDVSGIVDSIPLHSHSLVGVDMSMSAASSDAIMSLSPEMEGVPARLYKIETQISGIYTLLHDITKKMS